MNDTAENTTIGDNNTVDRRRDKLHVINTRILAIATLAIIG